MTKIHSNGTRVVALFALLIMAVSSYATVSVKVFTRDEQLDNTNISVPRIYIQNTGTETITNFYYRYYFTTENGKYPMLKEYYTPNESVMLVPYGDGYYVQYNVSGITLTSGGLHPDGSGNSVGLYYNDWSAWDYTNDFSNLGNTLFQENANVTVYVNNSLIYGSEPGGVAGYVFREVWTGITGISTADIPLADNPDVIGTMSNLNAPRYTDDNYGARIRGYITAPSSGDYTFFIASDNNSEFYLSTDDDPANKGTAIASVSGWTQPEEWYKYSTQQSAAQTLVEGNRYFFEILHKEGDQGDLCMVGWLQPGGSGTPAIVPGTVLTPYVPEVSPAIPTLSISDVSSNTVTLSWTNVTYEHGYIIEMATGGGGFDHLTTVLADITTYTVNGLEEQVGYRFKIKAYNDFGESDYSNAALATTFASTEGKISREVWTGINGSTIADIPTGTTASFTDEITTLETQRQWMDYYGQRIRGYIVPPTTGNYTFFIASDDYSQLWLSTDNDPADKSLVASVSGYTDYHAYTKYPSQKSAAIALTAGVPYYIEILHKDGNLNDNLSVGWCKPGEGTSWPSEVIPGNYLSPYVVPTIPDAPDNLTATAISATQIDLVWNDNSSNESGFQIERDDGSGNFIVVGTPGVNAEIFHDGGLEANTQYTYRVRSWNSVDNSAWSATADAVTLSQGIQITPDRNLLSFAVYSTEETRLRSQCVFNGGGNVGSNGNVDMESEAVVNGNVVSCADIYLHSQAKVYGDAIANGTITIEADAYIYGNTTEGATLGTLVIPEKTITTGTEDIRVMAGQSRVITPGVYKDVFVEENAVLTLNGGGQYSFASLFLRTNAQIKLDVEAIELIDIDIEGECEFSDFSSVTFVSENGGFIPFTRLYTNDNNDVRIGTDVELNGTFTAPYGTITLNPRAQCKGALYAKKIIIESQAIINSDMTDPEADYDNDGVPNIIEVVMNTNPYDGNDYIEIAIPSKVLIDNSVDDSLTYDYSYFFSDEGYGFATAVKATIYANSLTVPFIPMLPIVKNFPESGVFFNHPDMEVTGMYLGFHNANQLVNTATPPSTVMKMEFPLKANTTTTTFSPYQDDGTENYISLTPLETNPESQVVELTTDADIIFAGEKKDGKKTLYFDNGYVYSSNSNSVFGAMLAIKNDGPTLDSVKFILEYTDVANNVSTSSRNLHLDGDIYRMNYKFRENDDMKITSALFRFYEPGDSSGEYTATLSGFPVNVGQTAYFVMQYDNNQSCEVTVLKGNPDQSFYFVNYLAGDVTFESAPFAEGRIVNTTGNAVNTFSYDYYLRDHLGSTRMVVRDDESIVDATMYTPYGMMDSVAGIASAGLNVREKFTTKEYDEDGADFGKLDVDVTLDFGAGDAITLDSDKYSAIGVYYADYAPREYDRSEYDVILFDVDETNNTARAKGTIHYTADREIKWVHIQLNRVPGSNPPVQDMNSAIVTINETVGPGTKMTISKVINGSSSLVDAGNAGTPTMPKSFFTYPTDNYNGVKGIQAYYFGARYYDPEIGVWGSTDAAEQLNYAYGYSNSPVMMIDPDGNYIIGALAGMLLGGYVGGVQSSGSFNPGNWDAKDWMFAGMGAFGGAIMGSSIEDKILMNRRFNGAHLSPYEGMAGKYHVKNGAWDKFMSSKGMNPSYNCLAETHIQLDANGKATSMTYTANNDPNVYVHQGGQVVSKGAEPPQSSWFYAMKGNQYRIVADGYKWVGSSWGTEIAWRTQFADKIRGGLHWRSGGFSDFKVSHPNEFGMAWNHIMTSRDAGNAMWGSHMARNYPFSENAVHILSNKVARGVEHPRSWGMQQWGYQNQVTF